MGKTIGIEIGNSTIKLVVVRGKRVQTMAVKQLPENMVLDGKVTSPDAMTTFIKEMRKEFRIPRGNAALVLPIGAVITNTFEVPPMTDQELTLNLPFEFRDYVGPETGKFHYDYAVLKTISAEGEEQEKLEIFAAAVRKETIDRSYDMLKRAGLTLKVAIPREMALQNLLIRTPNEPEELCIIDIGTNSTHVYIFARDHFLMGREIEIGSRQIDEAIAAEKQVDTHLARTYKEADMDGVLTSAPVTEIYNNLAVEVMRAVNFYNSYGNQSAHLNDLYFCGGSSSIEPLREAVRRITEMNTHHIQELIPGSSKVPETLSCALAAGAALQ